MSDSLIVEPQDAVVAPLDDVEGAGVLSSWADFGTALAEEEPDPFQIAFTAAGAALDTLGAIDDPFDALTTSAVSWLIEHVWFLHEPLDALAGDPKQIVAQAETWHNVSVALAEVATGHRASAGGLVWEGEAGDAYRSSVAALTRTLDGVSSQADELSRLLLGTGAAVGTVRALIRDLIADLVNWLITRGLIALAAAPVTFGGAVGLFIVGAVAEALALGIDIARRITNLLDDLSAAGAVAGRILDAIRSAVSQLGATASYVQATARPLTEALDRTPAGEVTELGKQITGAKLDDDQGRPLPGG